MAHKKKLRNKALIQYWLTHKDDENHNTYSEIGEIFLKPDGKPLSKQRVHQIICAFKEKQRELELAYIDWSGLIRAT